MKTRILHLLLLIAATIQLGIAVGCANTGRGIEKDYQRAEDKVERAVK